MANNSEQMNVNPPNHTIASCRLCGDLAAMELLHGFGRVPVAGYLEVDVDSARNAPRYELGLAICKTCGLVQQAYNDSQEILVNRVYTSFQPTYSMSMQVSAYVRSFLERAIEKSNIKPGGLVLDLGSNDGKALNMLKDHGMSPIGFEPSANLAAATRELGFEVVEDYFGVTSAHSFLETHPPAQLVVTRHTLEHAFDPLDFLQGIGLILARDGMAVIEVPYMRLQMMNAQFQSLTFQHISFFTVGAMTKALELAGLEPVEVSFVNMDGGSMVVYVKKASVSVTVSLVSIRNSLRLEGILKLNGPAGYDVFFKRVQSIIRDVKDYIAQSCQQGLQIAAYGAGAKGQALLNMLSLDSDQIQFAIDDTPGNAGKFIPGTGISVIASVDPQAQQHDLVFITAPTHIQEIIHKESGRMKYGAQFFAASPDFHFVVT